MKKFIRDNLSIVIRVGITLLLVIFLIVLNALQSNSAFCEWWTVNISRFYQTTVGAIFKYIPFSMTEIFFVNLVLGTIVLLVSLIIDFVKKRIKNGVSKVSTIAIVYVAFIFTYVATTSLSYYRDPLPIELYEEKVDKAKFREIIEYFLDDFNYCSTQLEYEENGEVKMPYSNKALSKQIEKEYAKIKDSYFNNFTTYSKPMLSSFVYVEFQITGVYFGVLGESNYDLYMTHAEYPFTFAHEIAHQKGVMRENDAQMMGAYICLNSDDIFLRYSGYIYTFNSLLNLAHYTGVKDDYKELYQKINPNILGNYKYINSYWKEHDILEEFASFWNNLYLKIFGSESTDEYQDPPPVVDPGTNEIAHFSRYQKLYFQTYFNNRD